MTLELRREIAIVKKLCDTSLRIALEGLEEIAECDGDPHVDSDDAYRAKEHSSSNAVDAIQDVLREWYASGQTKTPYA